MVNSHKDIVFPEFVFNPPSPSQYRELISYQSQGKVKQFPVLLLPNKDQRFITLIIYVKAGSYLDGVKGKNGLSHIAWELLKSPSNELMKRWYSMAAEVKTSLSNNRGVITMKVLPQNFSQALMSLRNLFTGQISIDSSELDKLKASQLALLKQRNSTVSSIADRIVNRVAYGTFFYINDLPTKQSIRSISISDVNQFIRNVMQPSSFIVAVSGDFDKQEMKNELKDFFSNWPTDNAAFDLSIPSAPAMRSQGTYIYNEPGQAQAAIRVMLPGIKKGNNDFFALLLVDKELGDGMNSRLFNSVRTQAGLTYHIGSSLHFSPFYKGPIVISTQVAVKNTVKTVGLIKKELDTLASNGLVKSELVRLKKNVIGHYQHNFSNSNDIAMMLLRSIYNGDFNRDPEYLRNWTKKIDSISLSQINRVLKHYFNSQDVRVVLVGDESKMGDLTRLKLMGPIHFLPSEDPVTLKRKA